MDGFGHIHANVSHSVLCAGHYDWDELSADGFSANDFCKSPETEEGRLAVQVVGIRVEGYEAWHGEAGRPLCSKYVR